MLKHYLISGRVQGVGYRAFVHRTASALKLTGWVRNLRDGRVEALVSGPEETQQKLQGELERGPSRSFVESVQSRIVNAPFVWENFNIAADGETQWSQDS